MKKSTCKLLIVIGIVLLIIGFFLNFMIADVPITKGDELGSFVGRILITLFTSLLLPFSWVGIILIVIGIVKWKSEEEHKDLRNAQIQALKRGKINVELKGKIRKLK